MLSLNTEKVSVLEMTDPSLNSNQFDQFLRAFLQEHTVFLKQILAVYVQRMHVAYGETVQVVVDEVFQDTLLEIIVHGERFMAVQEPRAWFLAVTMNVLKRRRAKRARRERFEVMVSDLAANSETSSETDLLDQLASGSAASPEQALEASEQARELLSLVSLEDARVLKLSVLQDLDSTTVAGQLGVSPQAARVRLHRAVHRLRQAWQGDKINQQEEKE